jgi:NAD(P)-dependent dehydrogenase (short-subunit alcohol dehydrogenase family)
MMDARKVVIVTGASQGLGAAVARWLGKAGCRLTLVARNAEKLESTAQSVEALGGEALPIALDVAHSKACIDAVSETLKCFGRLDGIVNNAGILQPIGPIGKTDLEVWRYNVEVNLLGPLHLIYAALRPLRESGGRIVNVSTGAAFKPIEGWSAYCASKAGLTHLTRVLAEEEKGIVSIALRPGVVDTEMQSLIRREGPVSMPAHRVAYFSNLKDEGKLEPPEIPGRSIAWLVLNAPGHWSGRLMDYDDSEINRSARFFCDQAST